jgi:hypothetical protein
LRNNNIKAVKQNWTPEKRRLYQLLLKKVEHPRPDLKSVILNFSPDDLQSTLKEYEDLSDIPKKTALQNSRKTKKDGSNSC